MKGPPHTVPQHFQVNDLERMEILLASSRRQQAALPTAYSCLLDLYSIGSHQDQDSPSEQRISPLTVSAALYFVVRAWHVLKRHFSWSLDFLFLHAWIKLGIPAGMVQWHFR